MEPNSDLAIVTGLVGSLVSTLKVLTGFEARFASKESGGSDAHTEVSLRTSYQGLIEILLVYKKLRSSHRTLICPPNLSVAT